MRKCISFLFVCILTSCTQITNNHTSILGPIDLSHPALLKMHESPLIQRLKKIKQGGTPYYYCNMPDFSRYDHSIGVLYLVQKFGGDLKEQLAALTHDASHTVFSHVADKVFDTEGYQDKIHEKSLAHMGARDILDPFGISIHDINPEQEHFKRQEQPLPDMCADRIEYNLHTALTFGILNQEDIHDILNDLHYRNEKWYFKSIQIAEKFAHISLLFTEQFWGTEENARVYSLTTKIVKRAFNLHLFTENEFHYLGDDVIIQKINATSDPEIQFYIQEMKKVNMEKIGSFSMPDSSDGKHQKIIVKPKFRGINPLVLVDNKYVRLTSVSKSFGKEYERVKKKMKMGFSVNIPQY